MTKRFVVLTDPCTPEQEQAIRDYVKDRTAWWHWLPNSWLIVDLSGRLTATQLRDDIRKMLSGQNMMVLEFSDRGYTWSGFGPSTDEKNMFNWFRTNWKSQLPT